MLDLHHETINQTQLASLYTQKKENVVGASPGMRPRASDGVFREVGARQVTPLPRSMTYFLQFPSIAYEMECRPKIGMHTIRERRCTHLRDESTLRIPQ
jgi:hypothetical protein